ncbi:MAG: glutamate synthase large subunit [Deltaproteobacteria bacterium]
MNYGSSAQREKAARFGLYDSRFEHDACGVGFVCDIKGRASKTIIGKGLEVLERLSHRGATGADPQTGDGAGILIQIPHGFFLKKCKAAGITLPDKGEYGTGLVFLPRDAVQRKECKDIFAKACVKAGLELLGWRQVPVDNSVIGKTARETEPVIEQPFIRGKVKDTLSFDRELYVLRKDVENAIRSSKLSGKSFFYITNLSCRTFSYKGLLMPDQVKKFFLDLQEDGLSSAICLVHSRYSTNTFPTWDLAQPFRYLAHNGEINTLRGNINWMHAREGLLRSKAFGDEIEKLKPVIVPGGSDSAAFDNMFELLVLSGRPLWHAMMMMIPGAWQQHKQMDARLKDFYKFHSCFMEPWDGPAAIAFTDGTRIGAVLDRNGLRPCRYLVTKKDMVIMASEVGVQDIPGDEILLSGRLEPGKMFFIDTEEGRIIGDSEVKQTVSSKEPYADWLGKKLVDFDSLEKRPAGGDSQATFPLLKAFGYTREDLKTVIRPMVETGQEPVGSMGNDTAHSVLSPDPRLLYSYFKQLFAQVTNPAIDPIREELVMSLYTYLGPEKNILEESPDHCHKLWVKRPVLTDEELARLKAIKEKGFKTKTVSLLFDAGDAKSPAQLEGPGRACTQDFNKCLDRICAEARDAIKEGYTFIVLSDRGVDKKRAALPALLATGAVHQYLVKNTLRTQISIIVESAEPREVHHFALLFGFGADCINPYLAYAAIRQMTADGEIALDADTAEHNYMKAVDKGILKILSKMGISTLQSYRGAQIFEALGIGPDVIDRCFTGTVSRIGGISLDTIARETLLRHSAAFPERETGTDVLPSGGAYQWKKDGEIHLWNPDSIAALQDAVHAGDYAKYKTFAQLINDQTKKPCTLRGLLKFKAQAQPVSLEEVEPVSSIVRRFVTGAMSFGSISRGAHETIAIAMNRLGGRSNTGEGGEDPARFTPMANGDSRRSSIKQVASGRFGVTTNYLVNADEIQIKIAQGAKPGEGGQLPGHKVNVTIARTRYTTPGVTLISPPPHHDIYSIEDLAQLIFDLKNANPKARISVKLVSEIGVGTVAAGVAKGHADMILISGFDGGTGASPLSSIKHAGLPWELGLAETHQTLVLNDLRSRVRLQTDGQMRTGRDVAIAAMLGAEEYGFCSAALIVLGCVMLRHCNLNNCSLGIATQDDILEKRFKGKAEHLINYFTFVAQELREIMAQVGVRTMDELIGRTDLLEMNKDALHWKCQGLDYGRILYRPEMPPEVGRRCTRAQDHGISSVLDLDLIKKARKALEKGEAVKLSMPINNTNRTTGAMLSGKVCTNFGEQGLPEDSIYCSFKGFAGQSFGAFLAKGVTFELEGMANDYVGKGISGGKVIIYPDAKADYDAGRNIIIGNTAFYGAICGEAYIRGVAGERFCIRNSGLNGVVEGVGDHGCEYMTGGRIVIIGPTGRNFGAGMSGGIAYVHDPQGSFKDRCNMAMVELAVPDAEDRETIHNLLNNHFRYTRSSAARRLIDDFGAEADKFVKVMPLEYKRILKEQRKIEKKENLEESR